MFFDVILITFVAIHVANSHNNIMPMLKNQDSNLRFNRNDDLPSFAYEDQLSTPAPIMRPDPITPNIYSKIQYAPLNSLKNQKSKDTSEEYAKITPNLGGVSTPREPLLTAKDRTSFPSLQKSHLEPRVPTQLNSEAIKCYSTGKKVEVMTASRVPGHNAVYRSFSQQLEPIPREPPKPYKLDDFVRPLDVYVEPPVLTTTLPSFELPAETGARPFSVNAKTNQHYGLNPNNVETGPGIDKIKRQYSPYAKLHRLHLNIARVYSPVQVPPKAPPPFADSYPMNYERLPVQPQSYVPTAYQALPQKTNYVYSGPDKQGNYRFRLP